MVIFCKAGTNCLETDTVTEMFRNKAKQYRNKYPLVKEQGKFAASYTFVCTRLNCVGPCFYWKNLNNIEIILLGTRIYMEHKEFFPKVR